MDGAFYSLEKVLNGGPRPPPSRATSRSRGREAGRSTCCRKRCSFGCRGGGREGGDGSPRAWRVWLGVTVGDRRRRPRSPRPLPLLLCRARVTTVSTQEAFRTGLQGEKRREKGGRRAGGRGARGGGAWGRGGSSRQRETMEEIHTLCLPPTAPGQVTCHFHKVIIEGKLH